MKRMMMFAACALALGLGAVSAQATTLDITTNTTTAVFLGYFEPGIPPEQSQQIQYLNVLLGLAPNAVGNYNNPPHFQTITRSAFACPSCPASAVLSGNHREESEDPGFSNTPNLGTGYQFLVGHYGGGRPGGESLVWWVGGLTGDVTIPLEATNDRELSNWTLYNPTTSVPDGGMTLMLLGGALLGLEVLRRRFCA
jgi:hypothetical protein